MSALRPCRRSPRERGSLLLWIVPIVTLVAASGATYLAAFEDHARMSRHERARAQALWAAHGGIEAARAALASGAESRGMVISVGDVPCRVAMREAPAPSDLCTIRARAEVAAPGSRGLEAIAVIEAEVQLRPGALPRVVRWREE